MESTQRANPRTFLSAITNPVILLKWPTLAVIVLTTLVHVVGSVDLGLRDLFIRVPLAVLSLSPLFILLWIVHRLSIKSEPLRVTSVLFAYLLGGALRGIILESSLQASGVLASDFTTYRIFAGMTIVTSTCVLVAFTWTMIDRAQVAIHDLQLETKSLAKALEELRVRVDESDKHEAEMIQERISSELMRAIEVGSTSTQANLERLIREVVRPLSQDFARDIRRWEPHSIENLRLTLRSFWAYIDPIKHLKTPVVGIAALVISSVASLFALFEVRDAIEVIVGALLSYLITSYIIFRLFSRWLTHLRPPLRDLVLTLSFLLISIPAVITQRIALADTDNRNIYVVATLVVTPVFGWMIITGTAAIGLSNELTQKLREIRDELRWVIARINLLSWYRKGVISRLLHGPVQNSLQVAVLRLRSADESETTQIINEVFSRVDTSLKELLDPNISGPLELQTLQSIRETWQSIAEISIEVSESFREACENDLAAASIVTDLVQEICSNAIRHGEASRIDISATQGDGSIFVFIRDNGRSVVQLNKTAGLGTQFLDSCSIEWARSSTHEGNVLSLRVPTQHKFELMADKEK